MWLDITVAVVFTSVLCQGLCSDRKGKFPVFLRKNSIAYESMGRRLTHAFFRGWENINICTWFVIDQAIMIRIFRVLAQTFINNASHCDNGHVGLWEGASKPRDLLAAAQISPYYDSHVRTCYMSFPHHCNDKTPILFYTWGGRSMPWPETLVLLSSTFNWSWGITRRLVYPAHFDGLAREEATFRRWWEFCTW